MISERLTTTPTKGLIPVKLRMKFRRNTYRSALYKLENLLSLREIVDDYRAEGERVLMAVYAEAAQDFLVHPDSVRQDLAIIHNYSADNLRKWLRKGVGFSHIEEANKLQHIAHKPPMQLIEECYTLGGANGETMTVKELKAHALGEQIQKTKPETVGWAMRVLGNFPVLLGWPEVKVVRFNKIMDELQELLQ